MPQIRARIAAADRAVARSVNGTLVAFIFCIFQVDRAGPGKELRVTRVARRHDAVEEVHAARHTLDDVRRRTDAHQIARLVFWHIGVECLDDVIHDLRAFAHRKSADGIARQIQLRDLLHMADAQVGIGAALIDAPEHLLRIDRVLQLIQAGIFRFAAHEPAVSPANGFLHIFVRRGILNTFVEGHADIRAEIRLNLHTFLRPHEDLMPVDV